MANTKTKTKKIRVSRNDVGRQCLVFFDYIGRMEGIIVDNNNDVMGVRVYLFSDQCTTQVSPSQIVELGEHIQPARVMQ